MYVASFGASWQSYLWAKPSQRNLRSNYGRVWRIIAITVGDEAITNQKDQGRRFRTLDPFPAFPASALDACVSACVCVCVYCPCGSAARVGDGSTTGCNQKCIHEKVPKSTILGSRQIRRAELAVWSSYAARKCSLELASYDNAWRTDRAHGPEAAYVGTTV